MSDSSVERLPHAEVQKLMTGLADAKILDLDVSVRTLMEPVGNALAATPDARVSLHIVCCNEYGLITA